MIDQLCVAAKTARDPDDSSSRRAKRFVMQSRFCATRALGYSYGMYLPAPFHDTDIPQLHGHVARVNPLWRQHPADREALAVFQGPEVSVSPTGYPTKQLTGEVVPTWNYAVVHAYGLIRFMHDAEWLLRLVSSVTDTHEAARPAPWQVGDAPSGYIAKMLRAIVGFEIESPA